MKKFAMVFLVAALAVILVLSASAEYHKSMYYGVLKVEEGAITVDGQVDEAYGEPLFWYQADGQDDPGDYTNNGNWFFTTDKSENTDEVLFLVYNTENYAKGYVVWTDSALYFCMDTNIQGWSNEGLAADGSDMWRGYCLQLNLFDFAGDQNKDYGIAHMRDDSTTQFAFAGTNKGTGEMVISDGVQNFNAKTTRDGEHVIYEVELKWEDFLASKPAEKDAIGIDVAINLSNILEEGGSQKQLFFVGEESYHKRTHEHYSKVARYYLVTDANDAENLYAEHLNESEAKADDHSISLFGCNEVFGKFTLDTENKKAGYASLSYTMGTGTVTHVHNFATPVDGTGYDSLEFDLYVSDLAFFDIPFAGSGIELSSAGKCDTQEIEWKWLKIKDAIVGEPQVGWNHVVLAVKDAGGREGIDGNALKGPFNIAAINYMRIHFINTEAPEDIVINIDNMRLSDAQKVKEEEAKKEAQEVTDRIMALSEDITKDNLAAMKTRVTRARQVYDQLSDLAKTFVTKEAVTRLKDLEKKIGEMSFPATGTTGTLTWTLYEDGLLEIIGEGAMPDYQWNAMPWYNYRSTVTSVKIGDGVTSIGNYAFSDCFGLTTITIPGSVTSIGHYAFCNCSGLTSIAIPDGVTSIGNYAFSGCSGNLVIIAGNQYVANYCEANGLKYRSASIKENITGTIGELSWTLYTDGVLEITGEGAMPDYNSSDSAPWYNYRSFIKSVRIGNGVMHIGSYAFSGCRNLVVIVFHGTKAQWDAITKGSDWNNNAGVNTAKGTYILVFDSGEKASEGLKYTLNSDGQSYTIAGIGTCNDKDIVIPSIYNNLPVTSIGDFSFSGCSGISSITIPEGVSSIGAQAFVGCSGLTSITIPGNVTRIGKYAFYGCTGLTSITIPEGVRRIDSGAFYGCSGLTEVAIPGSVTRIGKYVFSGCSEDLVIISKNRRTTNYCRENGLKYKSAAGTVQITGTAGTLTWTLYTSGLLEISGEGAIPDYNNSGAPWNSCRSLIASVNIGNGVTGIGNYAFPWCTAMTSVTIPDSVTSIGKYAFYGCTGLTGITIPNNVTNIEKCAFSYCSAMTSVAIPDSVTNIGCAAFGGCSGLTSITIPDSVSGIGMGAFAGCEGLTSVIIPKGVTSIGVGAFAGCTGLTSISVDAGNTVYHSVGNCVVETASKTLVVGSNASVIPEGVTSIGVGAFAGCEGLTSITIPEGVTSVGAGAFAGCTNLTSISVDDRNTIYHSVGNCVVETASKTLVVGCNVSVIPEGVTSIGVGAFAGCEGLTSITIPDSVASIGKYAFSYCTGLTSITIPDSVTSIDGYAFSGCDSLQYNDYNGGKYLGNSNNPYNALMEGTATSGINPDTRIIAGRAFSRCTDLTSITIPDGVTSIGWGAFYGCSGLTSITLPDSVTSIGSNAFSKCSENLVIAAGNQYVENYCKENGIKTATRIVIDSKTVASGYSFTVDVFIKNNSGFAALEVTPVYPDAFQLVSIENGTLIEDWTTGGQYIWVADSNMSEDGLLMRFTFTTSKDIELGDYTVDFIVRGCVDYDEQDVTIVVQSGTISVVNIIFGDATGDGQVNINDIVRLKKYIAAYDYVTETSTVDVGAGADANGDGVIDALDIVRLKKYLANYDYGTGTSTVILGPQK